MKLKDIKYSILLPKSFSQTEAQNKLNILLLIKRTSPEMTIRKERKK